MKSQTMKKLLKFKEEAVAFGGIVGTALVNAGILSEQAITQEKLAAYATIAAATLFVLRKVKNHLTDDSEDNAGKVRVPPLAALAAAALVLVGCAQQYAGINHAKVDFTEQGQFSEVTVFGGKEGENVSISFKMPNGTEVKFKAENLAAFEGQQARAKVHQAITETVGEVAPEVVDRAVDSVMKAINPAS
jgi:hypothetical protein